MWPPLRQQVTSLPPPPRPLPERPGLQRLTPHRARTSRGRAALLMTQYLAGSFHGHLKLHRQTKPEGLKGQWDVNPASRKPGWEEGSFTGVHTCTHQPGVVPRLPRWKSRRQTRPRGQGGAGAQPETPNQVPGRGRTSSGHGGRAKSWPHGSTTSQACPLRQAEFRVTRARPGGAP